MSQAILRHHQVLLGPVVSEKTTMSGERENSVAFWVSPNATKPQIRAAVEFFFPEVKVQSVSTLKTHRDTKRFGAHEGRLKQRKKAYIKLSEGSDIQLSEFE